MHFASGGLLFKCKWWYCIECLISEYTEASIISVDLVAEYVAKAYLFIININSVFEEIIR